MSLAAHHLDAFYLTAQLQSFTLAAKRLHVTQSALSQRIMNLEEELGHTLLIRSRTGVTLTAEGQRLLLYCQQKEALEEELVGDLIPKKSRALTGVVRIGGFSSVLRSVIAPSLKTIFEKNTAVRFKFMAREIFELPGLLFRGEVDFLVTDRAISASKMQSIQLGVEKNVMVQKKNYSGPEVFLDHDENDDITERYFSEIKKKKAPQARHYVDDVYGIIDGVQLGLGRAIVPRHLIKESKNIEIVDERATLNIPVYLHFNELPYYTALQKLVIETLKSRCVTFLS